MHTGHYIFDGSAARTVRVDACDLYLQDSRFINLTKGIGHLKTLHSANCSQAHASESYGWHHKDKCTSLTEESFSRKTLDYHSGNGLQDDPNKYGIGSFSSGILRSSCTAMWLAS